MVIIMQFIDLVSFVHLAFTDKELSRSDDPMIVLDEDIIIELVTFDVWSTSIAFKTNIHQVGKPVYRKFEVDSYENLK